MQTISAILKITGSSGTWMTAYDKRALAPELVVGVAAKLRFDLRSAKKDEDLSLLPYPSEELTSNSYYLALDVDFDQMTAPKLLLSTQVSLSTGDNGETFLDALLPNTATDDILTALATKKTLQLHGEIGGYSGELADWVIGFDLVLRNRVWIEGGPVPPEVASDPEYLTAAQVKALIAEATRSETPGPAGTTPHIGENGNWWIGETDTGVRAAGKDGEDGEDAQPAKDGEDGEDGKSAYQLAVDAGFNGSLDQWFESLRGADGKGFQIDATGEPAELHAYDDEPAGFVFACSKVDKTAKTCTKYFYIKKSDDTGDWFEPLIDVTYEQYAKVATLDPVEFSAPSSVVEYLQINMEDYPDAWLAAVTVETSEGELQLPPGSNNGIRKVVRQDGNLRIYFGGALPEYEKGKLYFTQFVGLVDSTPIPDPGVVTDKTIYYGYITMADAGTISTVRELNQSLINAAVASGTIQHVPYSIATSYALNVPAYSWVVALVPSGIPVLKDNGVGSKTAFNEVNGGTNGGSVVTLETGEFEVFGELQIVTGLTTIYVGFEQPNQEE